MLSYKWQWRMSTACHVKDTKFLYPPPPFASRRSWMHPSIQNAVHPLSAWCVESCIKGGRGVFRVVGAIPSWWAGGKEGELVFTPHLQKYRSERPPKSKRRTFFPQDHQIVHYFTINISVLRNISFCHVRKYIMAFCHFFWPRVSQICPWMKYSGKVEMELYEKSHDIPTA